MNPLHIDETLEHGADSGRGNLLGIQPYMLPQDYLSQQTFTAKLAGYLDAAKEKNWLNPKTVVVFPEYLGSWLAVTGEKPLAYTAKTIAAAMQVIILSHPFVFARRFVSAPEKDRSAASIFRMQAVSMARIYQASFAQLASTYQVTIVAGSLILPAPTIQAGQLTPGDGPLYSTSAVFRADGTLHPNLTFKTYPISGELPFTMPARVDEIPAYDTPAGRLGVLICADSWYPAPYQQMKSQAIQILAIPSYIEANDSWDKPWQGYDGASAPTDVNLRDVNTLTEGQAWRKYALSGRLAQSGAACGVNVFLHGELWDVGSNSGQSILVSGKTLIETRSQTAALLNLWLS